MRPIALLLSAVAVLAPTVASASETVTYSYDAKGRLTSVAHVGGPADGVASSYTFDAADNRTQASVSGARPTLVVVPLNGLQVIVLSSPNA